MAAPPPSSPSAAPARQEVSIGIYITALFDLDPASQSFDADFVLWTNRPAESAGAENPLDSVVFPGSRQLQILSESRQIVNGVEWCLRRYHGRFFYDWNLWNFPFDRHQIFIGISDHSSNGRINYVPDRVNSGISADIDLPGWSVDNFEIENSEERLATTFGNPAAQNGTTSQWISITAVLQRNALSVFLKLMTGAYIAFGAAMLACFMKLEHPPVFSGRMVLLISCLFAVIVNNRATDSVMGREEVFTLPDLLHVLIYIAIFISMIVTLRSRVLWEQGQAATATLTERRITLGLTGLFMTLNVILIWHAAVTSIHSI